MRKAVEVVFYREGRRWIARALTVDVSSFGDPPDEAREAIREALQLYFEDEPNVEVPEVLDARGEELLV